MRYVAVFFCGALFAIGLGVSGMTSPAKVIGFLDIFGQWDPSLLFVMGGAVGVNLVFYRLTIKRDRPIFETSFVIPSTEDIDKRLICGAALFGVGWGLSGYCPGPALVSTMAGWTSTLVFVAAMLAGMAFYRWTDNSSSEKPAQSQATDSACG